MCLLKPRLREIQVHDDELPVRRRLLHNQLEFALGRLAVLRQVFDERALAVHVDVDRVCLRVQPIAIVKVLFLDGRCDHPLELVFPKPRQGEFDDDGLGGGAQDGNVLRLLLLTHEGPP